MVRVSGGHLCKAEAPTEAAAETALDIPKNVYAKTIEFCGFEAVPGRGRGTAERRWKGRLFTAESPQSSSLRWFFSPSPSVRWAPFPVRGRPPQSAFQTIIYLSNIFINIKICNERAFLSFYCRFFILFYLYFKVLINFVFLQPHS